MDLLGPRVRQHQRDVRVRAVEDKPHLGRPSGAELLGEVPGNDDDLPDAARAQELGIDKVPGIALLGKKDYNLRYFGLPSGYDFTPFVETVLAVANDDPGISRESVAMLARLKKPVQLSVFVTQH